MAGHYEIDSVRRRATLTIAGTPLPWAAFVRLVNAMVDDPAFAPGMPVLEDVRALAEPPPGDCMRAMVGLFQHRADALAGSRWAMVVDPEHRALYGLGRMAEILADDGPVAFSVFTDLEPAEAWLSDQIGVPGEARARA